jgi:CPA2 family monovalent cation:H+ antiporter-2
VTVSAITTFSTPFMVKFSTPFSLYLERKLPRRWVKKIERYSANTDAIKSVSTWQIVIRSYLTQVIIHSIIIVAIIVSSSKYLLPLVQDSRFGNALAAFITVVILSPFLWALSLRRVAVEQVQELMQVRKYQGPIIVVFFFRILLSIFYLGFVLNEFFSPIIAIIALIIGLISYVLFPKQLHTLYNKIEKHFLKNFNDRELTKVANRRQNVLSPWDGHMADFEIAKESNLAGKTLSELKIREQFGINIASIKRGDITINIPVRNERLFPGDEINIIGTDEQVKLFKIYLDKHEVDAPETDERVDIILQQLDLKNRACVGKSIRESRIREKTHGIIVGIERNGKRTLNPESDWILETDDIVWIAGDKKKINIFIND